ncbi:GNAT family N-acetyltransferase [Geodermatophilus sp. SYSU D00815]
MPPLDLPPGLTSRPLTPDDVDDAAALLAVAEEVDDTGENYDADDLTEWWVNELVDLRNDSLAVHGPDGALVAWATAIAPPTFRDAFSVHLEARVRPEHRRRGIGRALLDWQLARGAEIHAERHPEAPGLLTVVVPETMPGLAALVDRAGLTAVRWYRQMERPLADLPPVPDVAGVELAPFTWERDDEVRRAHNAAFSRHHGSSERDPASWQTLFTGQRAFRPDLSTLVLADGAVVAYALVYVYEADTRATGVEEAHYGQIGTLPEARGRGLASAAIVRSLQLAAASGCGRASLQVDSENVTGALRLYEALGFGVRRTQVSWSRALPPVRR